MHPTRATAATTPAVASAAAQARMSALAATLWAPTPTCSTARACSPAPTFTTPTTSARAIHVGATASTALVRGRATAPPAKPTRARARRARRPSSRRWTVASACPTAHGIRSPTTRAARAPGAMPPASCATGQPMLIASTPPRPHSRRRIARLAPSVRAGDACSRACPAVTHWTAMPPSASRARTTIATRATTATRAPA